MTQPASKLVERLTFMADTTSNVFPETKETLHEAAARITELEAEVERWSSQTLKEDDCRVNWQNRALAAEAQLERAWQDIETAPKDGTHIIVNDTRYNREAFVASWNDRRHHRRAAGYWEFADERIHGVGMSRANQPTHWMPLPASPAPLKTEGV